MTTNTAILTGGMVIGFLLPEIRFSFIAVVLVIVPGREARDNFFSLTSHSQISYSKRLLLVIHMFNPSVCISQTIYILTGCFLVLSEKPGFLTWLLLLLIIS